MNRTLLALAFVAAAGAAGAQTAQTPAAHDMNGAAGATTAPDMASTSAATDRAAATARKRIEADGYRDVQGLAKGPDGLWHGTAVRGNVSVQVTVDRSGNVSAK